MKEKPPAVENNSNKLGKKHPQDHHDHVPSKKKQVRYEKSQEEALNQFVSQNEAYEIEFESELRHGAESVILGPLKCEKYPKVENKVQAGPVLYGNMADIIEKNFSSRIYRTNLKDI